MAQGLVDKVARIRSFARQRPAARLACELCGAALGDEHDHVVERSSGQLQCCCGPCALLFRNQATSTYRTVPRDATRLGDFRMSDAQWENLSIPISLAFLFSSTRAGSVVAVYPSPAGGTESTPMPEAWEALVAENPVLGEFEPDVEALLVNRMDGARDYYRVPLDQCYRLTGLVRLRWRGFTGGVDLWREVGNFFETLEKRCST